MIIFRNMTMALAASLLLAACSHSVIRIDTGTARINSVPAGTSVSNAGIRASTDSRLGAAIVIAVMLADGLRYFRVEPDGTRAPVDAATAQAFKVAPPRVSIQDCTRPVDITAGNLLCR